MARSIVFTLFLVAVFLFLGFYLDLWNLVGGLSGFGRWILLNLISAFVVGLLTIANYNSLKIMHRADYTIKSATEHVNFSDLLFKQLLACILVILSHAALITVFYFYPFVKECLVMRYLAPLASAWILTVWMYKDVEHPLNPTTIILYPMLYYALLYI